MTAGAMRLVLLLLIAAPAHAQLYKCVDERGKTHYTDRKDAPGCKQSDIKASPPISGQLQPRNENLAGQEAEMRNRQAQREMVEKRDEMVLTQRCARLRQEYNLLSSGVRVGRIDAKGERVFMEDAAREQRLAQLQQELRGCP